MNEVSEMSVEQRKEYHRVKADKYRQTWKAMDIVTINILVPKKLKDYFQATAKVSVAEETIAQIENHDPELLEILADRQVRVGITREELVANVELYRDHGDDREQKDRFIKATDILKVFESIGEAKIAAIAARDDRPIRYEDELYWQAREYAACMYVQGALELFTVRESGIELPEL